MNKETVIAVMMVGLIILAGLQAIEISGMKDDLLEKGLGSQSSGAASGQGATRYSPSASSSTSSSAGMVGGC